MKGCNEIRAGLTEYLDGRMNGRRMQEVDAHLRSCRECAREWQSLRGVQAALGQLGPVPEPPDLPLRIRVALSQERARSRRSLLAVWDLAWRNTVGPFLLQAGAGLASAVLLLGTVIVLVTMFAQPETAQAIPDEPLGGATAPHLLYFSNAPGGNEADALSNPVDVEVYVNGNGEVYDYRIVSGPNDAATRAHVENMLLFSRFAPARVYGQPVRGLAFISFSGISVKG